MATEKITFKLPPGFDAQTHLKALQALIVERNGEGFEIDFIDPEDGVAHASRHVAITSVSAAEKGRASAREVKLPKETKASDGEKVAAMMADQYPEYVMIKFDPFMKRASLALMDAPTRRARDAVAVAIGVKPWDVDITPRPDGGFDLTLPNKYVPSKHDAKLEEVATMVVGREGWYVEVNAQTLRASIIPSDPPTFPPSIAHPFTNTSSKLTLTDNQWARVPLGVTLAKTGDEQGHDLSIDFVATPHGLISGTTGGGKGVSLMTLLSGALANGWEIAIADGVKGGVDYIDFQPFVRTSGWGDDLMSACCVISMVYEEGVRRKHLIKAANVQKWTQLPAKDNVRPLLLVVDELTSLIGPEALPKGVAKDNPLVTGIALRNLTKATILNNVGKIARELRFAGISLVCATQVASTSTGVPTELRSNLGAKILLGANPTDNNRRLALNDPSAVPEVPRNIVIDTEGAAKGVGVFEFEGQESGIVKVYFAPPAQFATWLTSLNVPTTQFPRPSSAEIASHTPSLEDDGGGEFDLRKLPPTLDPATGEELHGFAKANEQRRLLNGTSESAARQRLESDNF